MLIEFDHALFLHDVTDKDVPWCNGSIVTCALMVLLQILGKTESPRVNTGGHQATFVNCY